MSVEIHCPAGGLSFAVRPAGSGSGGVMCVRGRYTGKVALTSGSGMQVRVLVVAGPLGSGSQLPSPTTPGFVDADVIGQSWCARDVPVPPSGSGGGPMVVFAWAHPTGQQPNPAPDQSAEFSALLTTGPEGDDCCSGCGSGSGSQESGPFAQAAASLTANAAVRVTVPDGPAAGHHTAGPVARLAWRAAVGKVVCEVKLCPTDGLLVRVDGQPVDPAGVQFGPMSATLPGAAFGAAGPVLVTQA